LTGKTPGREQFLIREVEKKLKNSPASASLHKLTDDIDKQYKKAARWTPVECIGAFFSLQDIWYYLLPARSYKRLFRNLDQYCSVRIK
jgi:hypothetical protein